MTGCIRQHQRLPVSATTYNGDNYIKIGGTAWVLNTGATVPVL